jgi:hypothetical protein
VVGEYLAAIKNLVTVSKWLIMTVMTTERRIVDDGEAPVMRGVRCVPYQRLEKMERNFFLFIFFRRMGMGFI